MTFKFVDVELEPLEVEPVNKDGVRFYKLPKTDKYYPSVTSITSFKNAKFFKEWRTKIGEDEANRITEGQHREELRSIVSQKITSMVNWILTNTWIIIHYLLECFSPQKILSIE